MKNNIFLLIAASIFILSFSSCDDLLDVTPKDKITPETFFSTELIYRLLAQISTILSPKTEIFIKMMPII
jgi:hypothetical protein